MPYLRSQYEEYRLTRRTLLLTVSLCAVVLLVGYGMFEARKIVEGPQVWITTPINGSATSSPIVHISGVAKNIAFLSINGKQAFTNTAGEFSQTISPAPGYTVITVTAKDRFGREIAQTVRFTVVHYCPLS